MPSIRNLLILGLVFGAVPAETLAQASVVSLRVPSGPISLGDDFPCIVTRSGGFLPGQVAVFVALDSGSSPVNFMGSNFVVPLHDALLAGLAPMSVSRVSVPGSIPRDDALLGKKAFAVAAVFVPGAPAIFSPLVPFGPIIEDSIN